ncbi:MAG: type II 3-dehydroquinate dehydratase [Kiritimatiellia bacterium]|nr:type II 3-dehydroquinate dehydratase [Lentisphaerota bacterium]
MQINIINGPNLGMLGLREPQIYGALTLDQIMHGLAEYARSLNVRISAAQSNEEGVLVSHILAGRELCQGLIINPGGFTHTSVALRDAIQAVDLPCVEVHISNTAARDDFRHRSLTAGACLGQIMGFGPMGYHLALNGLVEYLNSRNNKDDL